MKKFLALGLIVAMMFVMAIPAMAVTPINYTTPLGTPALDGVKDDFYGEWIPINTIHSFDGSTETGATGKFAFAWDANALYVIAEVIDTIPGHDHNDDHQRDSVEIFIDWWNTGAEAANNDEGPYWLVRIHSDPEADRPITGFTNAYPETLGGWWGVGYEDDVLASMTRVVVPINGSYNNGYILEAKIPIAGVSGGVNFKAGTVVRFCLAINDNQGDGRATGAYPAHNEPDHSWDCPANHGYLMTLSAAPETGGDAGGAAAGGNEGGDAGNTAAGGGDAPSEIVAPPKPPSVKTGDSGIIILMAIMAAAGVVVLRRKAVR